MHCREKSRVCVGGQNLVEKRMLVPYVPFVVCFRCLVQCLVCSSLGVVCVCVWPACLGRRVKPEWFMLCLLYAAEYPR